jgi:uncharacterized protein (DUF885 family)
MGRASDARDPVFDLSDELVQAFAAHRPALATMVGVPCDAGAWGDLSPAGVAAWGAALASFQERLRALPPPAEADRWGRVARRVMAEYIAERLDEQAHREHLVDLNNIESTCQHLRMAFDMMDTASPEGWEAVLSRLETLERAMDGYRQTLEEGRRTGFVVARRQVLAGIEQAEHLAGPSSFFLTLPAAAAGAGARSGVLERLPAAAAWARSATCARRAASSAPPSIRARPTPGAGRRSAGSRRRWRGSARRSCPARRCRR